MLPAADPYNNKLTMPLKVTQQVTRSIRRYQLHGSSSCSQTHRQLCLLCLQVVLRTTLSSKAVLCAKLKSATSSDPFLTLLCRRRFLLLLLLYCGALSQDFIAKPATMQHLHNGELFAVGLSCLRVERASFWAGLSLCKTGRQARHHHTRPCLAACHVMLASLSPFVMHVCCCRADGHAGAWHQQHEPVVKGTRHEALYTKRHRRCRCVVLPVCTKSTIAEHTAHLHIRPAA